MGDFLVNLSKNGKISTEKLPNEIYDMAFEHIENSIRYSTKGTFEQNKSYKDLPTRV